MKVLIPDGEAASDPSWTQLRLGAFNQRPLKTGPQAAREFVNKLRMTNSVPIGATTSANIALVGANEKRSLLIMQNNSTATSPDSAPTMYFGFGNQPKIGYDLALPPGVGIVLDVRVPGDAIYVGFGPFVNTGGSTVIQGVIKEGGISDPANDTANIAETGQIGELIRLLKKALNLQ
jgi:hypothetical protein